MKVIFTEEQVREEKRAAAEELYGALVSLYWAFYGDAEAQYTLGNPSRGEQLRRRAERADKEDAAMARAFKTFQKIHEPGKEYIRADPDGVVRL